MARIKSPQKSQLSAVEALLRESLSDIHPSYLQDSPDFLRDIEEEINANILIDDGDILCEVDVSALYTNIPQEDGIETCRELLRQTK